MDYENVAAVLITFVLIVVGAFIYRKLSKKGSDSSDGPSGGGADKRPRLNKQ